MYVLRDRRGFTLFQLLLVLAILLILLALLLPALVKVRKAAARMEGSNNLKQILIATHNCNDTYAKLPPTVGSFPQQDKGLGTLHFYLLPFIEQANLYTRSLGGDGVRDSHEHTTSAVIKTFLAANDPSAPPNHLYDDWLALCNYPANYLVFRSDPGGFARIPATIPDGTSNTIFFGQRYQMCNGQPHAWDYDDLYYWAPMFAYYSTELFQAAPAAKDCDPERAQGLSADGILVGLGDGSTRFLTKGLSETTWLHACQPNDGFPLGTDW